MQVPRRIKVVTPDTPYFSIRRNVAPGRDESSKVAAGMEVMFTVTFRPESTEHYAYNLVVCTEREKFIVPILAAGEAPALDLPDLIEFGSIAAGTEARQTLLVRNVGTRASAFSLHSRGQASFSVSPSQGFLAPEETLQLQLGFVPPGPGRFEGELEVCFDGGNTGRHSVYCQLYGHGHELDVGLSQKVVSLLPTYVTKMSQRSFKVVNRSDTAVKFAVKANPGHGVDEALRTQRLVELGTKECAAFPDQARARDDGDGVDSEDEDTILGDRALAMRRELKPLRRAAALDAQLFGGKTFQVCEALFIPFEEQPSSSMCSTEWIWMGRPWRDGKGRETHNWNMPSFSGGSC